MITPGEATKPKNNSNQQKTNVQQPQKVVNTANPPKVVQETAKKISVEKTPPTEQPKTNKTVTSTTPTPKPEIRKPSQPAYNPNSVAMIDYKTKLRARLFSKFGVATVQGSGTCSIQFSVDSNGKLINRKFTKESANKTLNDAVYYMLMSVPTFNPPPAEYNGSPINMTFTVNNGNFEISIQ